MRNRIFVAAIIFCLAFTLNLSAQQPASKAEKSADPAHIQKLIENLGSVSFAEREQASKELEQIGKPALNELRKAVKSDDTETSCRATRLVARAEEKARTEALLAPIKIRLSVKDVTVMEAINELDRKIRPNKIEVIGDRTPLNTRKITLDTGEVSYWEALHQLCQKGRLVEQQVNNVPIQPGFNGRRGFIQPVQQQNKNIVLLDGTPPNMPISFAGSVRVRAMNPSGQLNPGETQVMLDVSAEQRLQSFGLTGVLIFDRAIDDQGQSLSFVPQQTPNVVNNFNGNGIMMVNGMMVPYGGTTLVPRTMGFRFHKGAKNARVMKELSGKLIVQALNDTEALVTVSNFRKSIGHLVKGKDTNSLQVQKVEALDNGAIRMEVIVEATPAQNGGGMNNFNGGNVGFMVLNGQFNGMINGVQFINGVPMNGIPTVFPKLVDVKGKAWDPEVNAQRPDLNNGRVLRHATLTYRPQAEANQLVLFGQRTILFAVPFSMKNVPLQ